MKMKITDLSIKSNNIQIKYLSEQEANQVAGGSSNSNLLQMNAGIPGSGGRYDRACTYIPSRTTSSWYSL